MSMSSLEPGMLTFSERTLLTDLAGMHMLIGTR